MDDTTTLLTALNEKVDRVLAQNHELLRQALRAGTPAELVDTDRAAELAGVSRWSIIRLAARNVLTDGRPPGKRTARHHRRFYADECVVYRTENEAGVRRLRETFGRE